MWVDIRGFHHNSDTARLDGLLHGNGNLFCETFLDLQATTESLRYAGELGNPKDEFVRDICDRNLVCHIEVIKSYEFLTHFTNERHQVVLTET